MWRFVVITFPARPHQELLLMFQPRPRTLTLAFALAAAMMLPALAGCQKGLFADDDPTTKMRLDRYYNGDSARETTEARRKSGGMGFGFPTGAGFQ
jgi:hypothetical protein